jgi:LmbE family N-acetylglucosaminyl deacetylase
MKLAKKNACVYVPDGRSGQEACACITHLGIGAHQDDLEIMAYHGIQAGYRQADRRFGGVTCTDGRGSSRSGIYADYTDEQMMAVRIEEQNEAARLGEYGVMFQLGHASEDVTTPGYQALADDLVAVLNATRPEVVYTHNPADKHETHIGVFVSTLQAIRRLPASERPARLLGCEVWRGLDWMLDEDKVALDVSGNEKLFQSLVGVFDSQIAGGKRYDLATLGRARANATYHQSHGADDAPLVWFAMDLTPLVRDEHRDVVAYVQAYLHRFMDDVHAKLSARLVHHTTPGMKR